MKLLRIPLLAGLTAALLCTSVMATQEQIDMSYYGPLDPFTGTPTQTEQTAGNTGDDLIRISDRVRFDPEQRMYVHYLDNTGSMRVTTGIVDGMYVSDRVEIIPDSGVALNLFLNGEEVEDPDWTDISDPGEYVVMLASGGETGDRLFSFTVVGDKNGRIKSYRLPEGFEMVEATLNGAGIYYDRNFVDLSLEGEYYIKTRCIRSDTEYELMYLADFTAPAPVLEGVEDGVARGPVTITGVDERDSVGLWLNGERIGYSEVITASGDYVLKVGDEAGNISTYQFTIQLYFDGNSIIFFGVMIAVVLGTVLYVLLSRKRLRVR